MRYFLTALAVLLVNMTIAKTWLVDPNGTYPTPFSVRNAVADGDTILIEAAVYKNQRQTYFYKNNLFIQGINGTPRIEGGTTLAANANGKALFVMNGGNCHVDNIEFARASVPDLNGAGIRQEGCDLLVTNCIFTGNEMGILGGNKSPCKVTIEHCIFTNNGNPKRPGYQHNVYINHIDTLVFRYNYTFDATAQGHELKSRAHHNIIMYNYIANLNSDDSRNIDLPNGGTAVIMGNIIEQSEKSVNSNLVGYGLEGLSNPGPHNIWVVNNTFINRKNRGNFVNVKNGMDSMFVLNNIFVGAKTSGLFIGSPSHLDSSSNFINDDVQSPKFKASQNKKYGLDMSSPCRGTGKEITEGRLGYWFTPRLEYRDTARWAKRVSDGKIDIGAHEGPLQVGIDHKELKQFTDFAFYPNPCKKTLTFSGIQQEGVHYVITSLTGRIVQEGEVENGRVELSLNPGVYLITLEDVFAVHKLIVEP